ncbi:hypothetical protein CLTEP_14440 [Clostridium tepidiprofundi DSM 19306]|uniref:Uncharacterized protein n=1 Tax=Clostridium tepidiprofundi DSM 19306 TaxID=1121338 RepID=A0A151B3Z9_9CLOT|nr:hypothetical protein [Clostridium tepidiprofundi]KYH34616.1 hypothetical protein CLTEP_14440 [Clostridium tepidiprofundi DSM 19306]
MNNNKNNNKIKINNRILDLLAGYKSVSIIGMAKNAGKTTTLNHVIKEARGKLALGLTSIGRDGEELDRVTATEKPKIYVEKGTFIATAKQCLFNSDITKEIIQTTGINTPMGEIIIARALSDGFVDIGGPSVSTQIIGICEYLKKIGCELVIVDGALSRKSFASPAVTEATILSTGAAYSKSMNDVINSTVHTVNLLTTESENDTEIVKLSNKLIKESRISVIGKDRSIKKLNVLTALEAASEITENLDEQSEYVVIKGVISDKLLLDIMKSSDKYKNVTFLAEDGTKLFVNSDTLFRFKKQGGILKVINPINIACVTCNPMSPYGYEFNVNKFLGELRNRLDIPVFDVVGGE